jgi:hypothetical protein
LNDLEIPKLLPENWRNKWEKIINKNMFETFHDPLPAYELIPRKDEILQINQDAIRRLMDSVAQYWI